jgi:peptide/nickel transport system substrate-binding protein
VKSSTTKTTAKSSVATKVTAVPVASQGLAQVTTPPTTASSEPVQPGGIINALVTTEITSLDPARSGGGVGGGDSHRLFALYDALLYQDPSSGGIIPQTLVSMTSTDAVTWTLKVKPGIKFTDNTAYDAAAIKFNWDRALTVASSPNGPIVKTFTSTVVDPLTLSVKLNQPNGQFPRTLSANQSMSAIASPAALQARGDNQSNYDSAPVGAGPFIMKEWIRDSKMTFVRNPNYWNSPRPYVDQVIFRPIVDESQRENTFKSGDGQVLFTAVATTAQDLQGGYPVVGAPSLNTGLVYLNVARAPFSDTDVRRAMQLAVDLDAMNKTMTGGVTETPKSFFPANYPYSDPSLNFPSADVAKAQALVDPYIAKNGEINFSMTVSNSPASVQRAQIMQQQQIQRLKGVHMNLKVTTTNGIIADILARNFDMISSVYNGADPEPQFTETVVTKGSRNYTGYSNPAVDQAVADSRAALDGNTRVAALKKVQSLLLQDVPLLVLYRSPYFWAQQANIKDLATFDEGGLLSDRIWIKTR